MPPRERFGGTGTAIEIDGAFAGFPVSAVGGEPFADVVEQRAGALVDKKIGRLHYAPIVLEVVPPLAAPLLAWVATALAGELAVKDGALLRFDDALREESRLRWASGLITEVAFPAADVTRRDQAKLRVTIQPAQTDVEFSTGPQLNPRTNAQKAMLTSNFRFTVSGLESSSRHVMRTSSLSMTQLRDPRSPLAAAAPVDLSDISVWVPESQVEPFTDWFQDFVLDGNNGPAAERSASLAFLHPNLSSDLIEIQLSGVGIFRISREEPATPTEVQALVKIEMYCEEARLVQN